jgi:predicted lipoprotein
LNIYSSISNWLLKVEIMTLLYALKPRSGFLLSLFAVLLGGCTFATIRPLDPTTGKPIIGNEDQQFNAANYVESIWEAQVIPALQSSANDLTTVLEALRENSAAASTQYGRREGSQPYSFMVTGTGTILSVNLESRAGLALIDLNADGTADASLAIGPVIRGTAVRDSLPFIRFNQFTNQMEYAAVSNEIHTLINQNVLTPIGDLTTLQGKNITFYGAFTLGDVNTIIVTPAILTVNG